MIAIVLGLMAVSWIPIADRYLTEEQTGDDLDPEADGGPQRLDVEKEEGIR